MLMKLNQIFLDRSTSKKLCFQGIFKCVLSSPLRKGHVYELMFRGSNKSQLSYLKSFEHLQTLHAAFTLSILFCLLISYEQEPGWISGWFWLAGNLSGKMLVIKSSFRWVFIIFVRLFSTFSRSHQKTLVKNIRKCHFPEDYVLK